MTAKDIAAVFEIFRLNNPNPTTELAYSSQFELLIAVVLSAQATDISVNKATSVLFKIANTPKQILALGLNWLEQHIKSIGLYKTKAKNIISLCSLLINEYNSEVPQNFDDLISLPGVGRKSANVILNTLYGHNLIAVDTHVFRVSNRLGIAKGNNVLQVENELHKNVPQQYLGNAHHWLILHGRYICKFRKPECQRCAVNQYCEFYNNII